MNKAILIPTIGIVTILITPGVSYTLNKIKSKIKNGCCVVSRFILIS